MDLNELLHAHQVEVMKASASDDERGRQGHFDKVAIYAERIRQLRSLLRTMDGNPSQLSQETVAQETRTDDVASNASTSSLDSWEDDGGALYPPFAPLPAEITTKLVKEYRVGPYVYQDLELALAEYEREKSRAHAGGWDPGHE